MTDRELMQQALDAATEELPKVDERETVFCSIQGHHLRALCEFVRAALTQPEPEPVAWLHTQGHVSEASDRELFDDEIKHGWTQKPLYTALPQREWQGLTDEEIKEIIGPWGGEPIKGYTRELIDKIEAKLKEKNT